MKLQPGNLQTVSLSVLLDVKAGRIDDALRGVTDIQRQKPKSPAGFELEGDIHASQKQYAKAASSYSRARKLGSGTRVLLKEAIAVQKSQSSGASIQLLEKWLKEHSDDVVAEYALATAYSAEGRQKDAMSQYEKLLKKSPKHVPALNDLAWLTFANQKPEKALKLAEKAYDLSPHNGPVLDTLGWVKLQQGQTKQALGMLRQAAEKMPEIEDVQYHLAVALARSGKKSEARKILERILGKERSFPARREAQQLLNNL